MDGIGIQLLVVVEAQARVGAQELSSPLPGGVLHQLCIALLLVAQDHAVVTGVAFGALVELLQWLARLAAGLRALLQGAFVCLHLTNCVHGAAHTSQRTKQAHVNNQKR